MTLVQSTCLWLAGLLLAQAPAPSAEQLQQWIRQLGDTRLATRIEATEQLWKAGEGATAALEAAQKQTDLEIATRARYVLDRIRAGVIPGADPEVTKAVEQFRFGDANAKRQALDVLLRKGEIDRIRWLIDREPDENLKAQFNRQLMGDLIRQTADKIAADDDAGALALLEEINRRGGPQHLAAYLHLTGRAAPRISQLQGTPNLIITVPEGQLLWYLLRLEGDQAGAKKLAEVANAYSPASIAMAYATFDWKALAANHGRATPSANANVMTRIQHYGFLALLRRAGGNAKGYDDARQKLLDLVETADDASIGRLAETLVLLDERAKAEEILRGRRRTQLAELLANQGRYREAFEALAIVDPRRGALAWFEKLDPNDHRLKIGDPAHPFHAGRLAARLLYAVGEQEQSLKLFDALAKVGADDDARKFALLNTAKSEWDLGIGEQAERHVAEALATTDPKTVFNTLLVRIGARGVLWWEYFLKSKPNEPKQTVVRTVRQLCLPGHEPRLTDAEFKTLVDDAAAMIEELAEEERYTWWLTLGETCSARGQHERALEFFRSAATLATTNKYAPLLRMGDSHVVQGRWSEAATAFEQAWNADRRQPLARILHGHALVKAGQKEAGEKTIRNGRLMALGDLAARHTVAGALKERGLRDLAGGEYELETRLSLFNDFNVIMSVQELAQRDGINNPLRAIDYWQVLIARIIEVSANLERDGALRLPQNIHRLRANHALVEKRYDDAFTELKLAQDFVPHDVELVLGVLPRLEGASRKADGNALFDRAYAAVSDIVKTFPDAAVYRNNLAWLSARGYRRLDEALEHAEKAVALRPNFSGHLDTLAEVHFQRGDRAKAIELEKRCLELVPGSAIFKKQLERFEKEEPGPIKEKPEE